MASDLKGRDVTHVVVHHVAVEAVVVPDLFDVIGFEELLKCLEDRSNLSLQGR